MRFSPHFPSADGCYTTAMSGPGLDVEAIRAMFPALDRREHGHPVAYLDGPGGTQAPQAVIEAVGAELSASAIEDILWSIVMLPEFQIVR